MNTYIVRNISSNFLLLKFSDSPSVELAPHGSFIMSGPSQNEAVFQHFVNERKLEVWIYFIEELEDEAVFSMSQMESVGKWLEEGF